MSPGLVNLQSPVPSSILPLAPLQVQWTDVARLTALIYVTSSMVTLAQTPFEPPVQPPLVAIKRSSYVIVQGRRSSRERERERERGSAAKRTHTWKWFISGNWCHNVPKKRKGLPRVPAFLSVSLPISLLHSLPCSLLCVVLIILILNLLKLTNDIRRQHRRAASWEETGCPSSPVACQWAAS